MIEYVAYAVLGAVMICRLLYVTMSPEAEDRPKQGLQIPSTEPNLRQHFPDRAHRKPIERTELAAT